MLQLHLIINYVHLVTAYYCVVDNVQDIVDTFLVQDIVDKSSLTIE